MRFIQHLAFDEQQMCRTVSTHSMRAMLMFRLAVPALAIAELRPSFQLTSLQHAYFDRRYAQESTPVAQHSFHMRSPRHFSAASETKCWQCGGQTVTGASLFFCQSCKAIQPPAAAPDLFAVMGLPEPIFDLDPRQLEIRYKHLQRDLHPDKFGQRDVKEQEFSAEQSSLVNHAYTLLKSPLRRALYVLQRKGVVVSEDGGTISDPELLMDVMEQREAVEETDDVDVLQDMLAANQKSEANTVQKLSSAFKEGDLEKAQTLITDLRYVTRTGEAITKKLP